MNINKGTWVFKTKVSLICILPFVKLFFPSPPHLILKLKIYLSSNNFTLDLLKMEQIQNQGDVVQTEIKSQEPVDNGNTGQIPNSPKARNGRMLKLN